MTSGHGGTAAIVEGNFGEKGRISNEHQYLAPLPSASMTRIIKIQTSPDVRTPRMAFFL